MEKDIKSSQIDIVIKNNDSISVFEIKDPRAFQRALLNEFRQEFSIVKKDTVVIYPEQKIIDSQSVFIETNSIIL
jgi:hypothetical protein